MGAGSDFTVQGRATGQPGLHVLHDVFYDYSAAPAPVAPNGELLTHMPHAEHPHGMAVPEEQTVTEP